METSFVRLFALAFLICGLAGCAAEEAQSSGLPAFNFPVGGEEEGGEEGSGESGPGGESSGEEGSAPVAPELLSMSPESCMGASGSVQIDVSHPSGIESVILFRDEEEVALELEEGEGTAFVGTLDMTVFYEGVWDFRLEIRSVEGTVLEKEFTWQVDTTVPGVSLDTPEMGAVISGDLVVEGKATDTGGCGVGTIVTSFDGLPVGETTPEDEVIEEPPAEGEEEPVLTYMPPTSAAFSHVRDTSFDGTSMGTLKIAVTDRAGNVTEETRVLTVVKPLNMLYVSESRTKGQVASMASGDWDGDSLLDMFVASGSGVQAAASLGKGKFGQWETLDEQVAELLATGDLDDDGDTDFVTYRKEGQGGFIRVVLRGDDGSYTSPQEVEVLGERVTIILLEDMTGDGALDVVLATQDASQSVGVIEAVGNGGEFKDKVEWAGGVSNISDMHGGDFNSDLNTDIVVVNTDTKKVNVFLGDGDGGFFAANDTIIEESANRLVPGYFDADDQLDLILSLPNAGPGGKIAFLQGQGNGKFVVSPQAVAYGGGPRDLAQGDFDNDGLLDVVAVYSDRTAAVYFGRDGYKPDTGFRYVVGPDADFVQVGAFTGGPGWDGLDIAVLKKLTGVNGEAISVLGGDGTGFFHGAPVLWNLYLCPGKNYSNCSVFDYTDMALGDFDPKPGLDIATITKAYTDYQGSEEESVYKYDINIFSSDDGFLPGPTPVDTLAVSGYFTPESWSQKGALLSIYAGDFDGDGASDIAVANKTLYKKPPGSDTWSVAPENVDVLIQNNGFFDSENVVGMWAGRDPAAFFPDSPAQQQGALEAICVGDVDGDERVDIVGVTPFVLDGLGGGENTSSHLTPWLSHISGQFLPGIATPVDQDAIANPGTKACLIGDVDQDGKQDLVSVNPEVDNIAVHYGDGIGSFEPGELVSVVSPGAKVVSLVQLNQEEDNFPDLISVGQSELFIAFGREHIPGQDPFDPPESMSYEGGKPSSIVTVDINQDGLEDIVVADGANSAAYVYAGIDSPDVPFAPTALVIQTSNDPRSMELGDLDEDGCPDLVILGQGGLTLLRNQACEGAVEEEPEASDEGGEGEGEEGEEASSPEEGEEEASSEGEEA